MIFLSVLFYIYVKKFQLQFRHKRNICDFFIAFSVFAIETGTKDDNMIA